MAAQMNITLKEQSIFFNDDHGVSEMSKHTFQLPITDGRPLIEIARTHKLQGWTVTKLPGLLWKATKVVQGRHGAEDAQLTVRFYSITQEWTAEIECDLFTLKYESEDKNAIKRKIKEWTNGT